MPPEPKRIKIRDTAITLRRAGSGQTVLFLHGAGGYTQWLPFFDALAEDHTLLVPEHPGFGASDDPAFIRSVSDMAMFYLDALEELDLDDIHLVGHSLGGWIAAELLIRDRARVKSLTLLAPAGLRVEGVPSGDLFIWNQEELARNLFHNQSYADVLLALKPTEEQMDQMLKNRFTATKLGWQPRWYNPALEKWLHRAKLPALIVWGKEDKVMPAAYAARWKERLPDARLVMLDESGHLPHIEKMRETAGAVQSFLKEIR